MSKKKYFSTEEKFSKLKQKLSQKNEFLSELMEEHINLVFH